MINHKETMMEKITEDSTRRTLIELANFFSRLARTKIVIRQHSDNMNRNKRREKLYINFFFLDMEAYKFSTFSSINSYCIINRKCLYLFMLNGRFDADTRKLNHIAV